MNLRNFLRWIIWGQSSAAPSKADIKEMAERYAAGCQLYRRGRAIEAELDGGLKEAHGLTVDDFQAELERMAVKLNDLGHPVPGPEERIQ